MKPKSFNFYLDYIENIDGLTDEETGQLLKALLTYTNTGEIPEMSPIVKVAFTPMRKQIDVEFLNYQEKVKARTEAGKKGAEKRWQNGDLPKNEIAKNSNAISENGKNGKCHENKNENKNENKDNNILVRFAEFWNAYPRKVNKSMAQRAYERLKPDDNLHATIMTALERHKDLRQWREDIKLIPHASTWLNQRRWEDEFTTADFTPPNKKTGRGQQRDGPGEDMMDIGLGYVEE